MCFLYTLSPIQGRMLPFGLSLKELRGDRELYLAQPWCERKSITHSLAIHNPIPVHPPTTELRHQTDHREEHLGKK